ncbi:MAG: bifunctional hydroxymethylpyrimidine kinase/phosphomethylpyrimidine kinase [bacterium]
MKKTNKPPVALTIAGSDSGGGAGIQADLKAFNSCGVHGCSVITVLTAQNSRGVDAIQPAPPGFVDQQIETILSDFSVAATKTGMLFNKKIIEVVVDWSSELDNLVVDPVMVATSGDSLLAPEAEHILVKELLPRADLITPNLPEARKIAAVLELPDYTEIVDLARAIACRLGNPAVLLKGGHLVARQAVDYLAFKDGVTEKFTAVRVKTENTHGSGCGYSALIAAGLARELPLAEAIGAAKKDLTARIKNSYKPGRGPGTLNWLRTR